MQPKKYKILLAKLSEDCKVFLDCIDLVGGGEIGDIDSYLEARRKELLSMAEKESIKDSPNQKFIDNLLDNVTRVDKISNFLKEKFCHV